jgi:hypothetical protein
MTRCCDCGKNLGSFSQCWTLAIDGERVTLDVCKRCARRLHKAKAENLGGYRNHLVRLAWQQESHSNGSPPAPRK